MSVFLVFLILFLAITFYSIIETQERPHSKVEVSRIIREDFFKYKSEYTALASSALNTKSYSNDWLFENNSDNGLQFFSETSFDSCKIPKEEYIRKYYNGKDSSTPISNVPDFDPPERLSEMMKEMKLLNFHYQSVGVCSKRNVTFVYEPEFFTPEGRIILFRYFPEGICREEMDRIKKSDNKWNWSMYLDKNWIAASVKTRH